MIRVLIADDHHLVRQGIRALLEKSPSISVIGEAKDGLETLAFTSSLKPDVLLLDVNMPHLNGIDIAHEITESGLDTAIVFVSYYSNETMVRQAFQNGARAYLLKKSVAADLLEAIDTAFNREYYISPELRSYFTLEELKDLRLQAEQSNPYERLTTRELEVCQMVVQGMTNQGIAVALGISKKTVEKHRANLMLKLGVNDLASLIREALRRGFTYL